MIRQDLHVHSEFSDGYDTIERIVKRAHEIKLDVIAITDHFWPSLGSKDERGLIERRRGIINEMRNEYGLRILDGAEVDIMPDGTLAPIEEGYDQFDIIIGSVHFCLDSNEWAKAVSKAAELGIIDILGHFDGYLQSYSPTYGELVARSLAKNNVAIELSSRYEVKHLDFIELARDQGCKFTIGSDAHSANEIGRFQREVELARVMDLDLCDYRMKL